MLDVLHSRVDVNRGWCGVTDSDILYILVSIKWFLASFKFLETAKDG